MITLRRLWIALLCLLLLACSDDPDVRSKSSITEVAQQAMEEPANHAKPESVSGSGGVSIEIRPEQPTSEDCVRAIIHGTPGSNLVIWSVNGSSVLTGTETLLCSDHFSRGDTISVQVGTKDQGGADSVTIVNSPPRIIGFSATPENIFPGQNIEVFPEADDADGDTVDFSYQWHINGEADVRWTEAVLPAEAFTKGDVIQVQVIPNDFFQDGPVYTSYAMEVPNAPPQIISSPPETITSLDYRYQVNVQDPDDKEFSYRLEEAPEGMTIDAVTGLISWSLTNVIPGDYRIAIVVTDPSGAEAAQEYILSLQSAR